MVMVVLEALDCIIDFTRFCEGVLPLKFGILGQRLTIAPYNHPKIRGEGGVPDFFEWIPNIFVS